MDNFVRISGFPWGVQCSSFLVRWPHHPDAPGPCQDDVATNGLDLNREYATRLAWRLVDFTAVTGRKQSAYAKSSWLGVTKGDQELSVSRLLQA